MMSRIPTRIEETQKLPISKRKPQSVGSYSQATLSSDKMSHKPCFIPKRAGTPILKESSLNIRSSSLEPEVFYSPKHEAKGTGNNNVTNRRIKRASLSPQRDLWVESHGSKSHDMKLKREYENKLHEKTKEINDLRKKIKEYEQLVSSLEEFLGYYPSVQVLSELIPSTGVVDESSYVSLLVEHIVLKALFSLQEQALTSHSGTQVKPVQPVFPVPVPTSHGEISRVTDTLIPQPFIDQPTHLSSSSTDTMNSTIPACQIVPDDSLTLDKTITRRSQTDTTSIPTQIVPYQPTMNRTTQTDPELNCNDLLSPESVHSFDSSQSSHFQQKLEAMTISNELLQSSLDAARRQIASLEITVANQREEIMNKESQITVISNRVATLMKSFESTQSDTLQYKGLYHRSLQQCAILQEQLDQFNCLFTKLETLLQLQNQVNSQEKHNKLLLETWLHNLFNWETDYIQKKQEVVLLKTAYDSSTKECSHLRDMNCSLELSHRDFEQQLARQVSLVAVSAAKETLLLEEIETSQNLLKEQKAECQELHGKVAQLLDTFRHSHDEYLETAEFAEVERQTLLEANKELEEEVKRLISELQKGETEYKKLVNYIKDFQSKSTHKTELLKSNLSKADAEIDELDKLIEHIRQVMHDNISVISGCDPLISLLKQIDVNDPAP